MTSKADIYSNLTQLGGSTAFPESPDAAVLEKVPNPQDGTPYSVRFTVPEFTSLCPITGQPDFAHLVIDYVPGKWLVESKSLKLYLGSFRNHLASHVATAGRVGAARTLRGDPQERNPRGAAAADAHPRRALRHDRLLRLRSSRPVDRGNGATGPAAFKAGLSGVRRVCGRVVLRSHLSVRPGIRASSASRFCRVATDARPRFDPTGTSIAFDRKNADGYYDVYVSSLNGEIIRSVTEKASEARADDHDAVHFGGPLESVILGI